MFEFFTIAFLAWALYERRDKMYWRDTATARLNRLAALVGEPLVPR